MKIDTAANTLMNNIVHQIDKIWEALSCDNPLKMKDRRKPSIVIGGCCRTTVETISTLRSMVDEYLIHDVFR
jgi:S-methylmethionine-dependent homocysteine/selenocysteine methylase